MISLTFCPHLNMYLLMREVLTVRFLTLRLMTATTSATTQEPNTRDSTTATSHNHSRVRSEDVAINLSRSLQPIGNNSTMD